MKIQWKQKMQLQRQKIKKTNSVGTSYSGGSGGGSVNIFFKKALTKGSITVSGRAGGRGSINCGKIISKTYSAK